MPAKVGAELQRVAPDQIADVAYEFMGCAYQLHNELGRFSNELSYKRLISKRFGGIQLEVAIDVSFQGFSKTFYIDTLVRNILIVEWKAVERLVPKHRSQLLNYLLLCELPKGKLINTRNESVEHEFVNTTLTLADRREFQIDLESFDPLDESDRRWSSFLLEAIRDWGTGLDLHLYESAIAFQFGGDQAVIQNVDVVVDGETIGTQKARLVGSGAAYRVTALQIDEHKFEQHARKLLSHTNLPAIHWINVARQQVSIKTLAR